MSLGDDLRSEVAAIFEEVWQDRDGQRVPEAEDLRLGNDAVKLDATVLYADLAASTALVDKKEPYFAAEVYKAYLWSAAKIIRAQNGVITSYDGDRIMAVFIGGSKNGNSVRAALKINHAVTNIVNPALKDQYGDVYRVEQTVGIDTSPLWIARTGIRGSNDLVWVGRAANYAAKLAGLPPDYPTWITADVHSMLPKDCKFANGNSMWEPRTWTAMDNHSIYRSSYLWKF